MTFAHLFKTLPIMTAMICKIRSRNILTSVHTDAQELCFSLTVKTKRPKNFKSRCLHQIQERKQSPAVRLTGRLFENYYLTSSLPAR